MLGDSVKTISYLVMFPPPSQVVGELTIRILSRPCKCESLTAFTQALSCPALTMLLLPTASLSMPFLFFHFLPKWRQFNDMSFLLGSPLQSSQDFGYFPHRAQVVEISGFQPDATTKIKVLLRSRSYVIFIHCSKVLIEYFKPKE